MQKFTPRKTKSKWSKVNKDLVAQLLDAGLMKEPGLKKIEEAKQNGLWFKADKHQIKTEYQIPDEFQKALDTNKDAHNFFKTLAPGYQKQFILWIATAKRETTKQKRIKESIKLLENNKKLGIK